MRQRVDEETILVWLGFWAAGQIFFRTETGGGPKQAPPSPGVSLQDVREVLASQWSQCDGPLTTTLLSDIVFYSENKRMMDDYCNCIVGLSMLQRPAPASTLVRATKLSSKPELTLQNTRRKSLSPIWWTDGAHHRNYYTSYPACCVCEWLHSRPILCTVCNVFTGCCSMRWDLKHQQKTINHKRPSSVHMYI